MKKYIILFFCAGLIFACGDSSSETNSNDKKTTASAEPKKAVDGKKVWKTFCVACHGLYGDMEVNGAKDLNLSTLPLAERIEIITNGKNVMTPFKDVLSPEQIEAVAKFTIAEFKAE